MKKKYFVKFDKKSKDEGKEEDESGNFDGVEEELPFGNLWGDGVLVNSSEVGSVEGIVV